MDISQAQAEIKRILGQIEHPRLGSFIALTEEVGELAAEIMELEIYEDKDNTQELEGEIADVFICLLELCNVYQLDLEKTFQEKLINIEPRAEEWVLKYKKIQENKRKKLD